MRTISSRARANSWNAVHRLRRSSRPRAPIVAPDFARSAILPLIAARFVPRPTSIIVVRRPSCRAAVAGSIWCFTSISRSSDVWRPSIAIQVQDLRASMCRGRVPPLLELPRSLQDLANRLHERFQLLSADARCFSGRFLRAYFQAGRSRRGHIVMQRATDSLSGNASWLPRSISRSSRPLWLRGCGSPRCKVWSGSSCRRVGRAVLRDCPALIAVVSGVVVTVLSSLRSLRAVSLRLEFVAVSFWTTFACQTLRASFAGSGSNARSIGSKRLSCAGNFANAAHELRTRLRLATRLESRFRRRSCAILRLNRTSRAARTPALSCAPRFTGTVPVRRVRCSRRCAEGSGVALLRGIKHYVTAATPDASGLRRECHTDALVFAT